MSHRKPRFESLENRNLLSADPVLVRDFTPLTEDYGFDFGQHEDKILIVGRSAIDSPSRAWLSDGTSEGTVEVAPIEVGDVYNIGRVYSDRVFVLVNQKDLPNYRSFYTFDGEAWIEVFRGRSNATTFPEKIGENRYRFLGYQELENGQRISGEFETDGVSMAQRYMGEEFARELKNTDHLVHATVYFDDGRTISHRGRQLSVSDGTREGTSIFEFTLHDNSEFGHVTTMAKLGKDRVVFMAQAPTPGFSNNPSLWVSDGTPEGTIMLRDEGTSRTDFAPTNFVSVGDYAIFSARDDEHGRELWVTDGTPEGTQLLVDANPNNTPSDISSLPELKNQTDIWRDGAIVSDGKTAFVFHNSAFSKGRQYVTRTNGTLEGTNTFQLPAGITIADGESSRAYVVNGRVYFRASEEDHGAELWTSDGTLEGTKLVFDSVPGPAGSSYFVCKAQVADNLMCQSSFTENEIRHTRIWAVPLTQDGDVNLDGDVTFSDFLQLSVNFGKEDQEREDGDLNGDGLIEFADFLILSENFGKRLHG